MRPNHRKEEGRLGESGCLRVQPKEGGILHLRLNNYERPIANKYRKGKMQRTLKRESKELEVVGREAIAVDSREDPNFSWRDSLACSPMAVEAEGIR